MRRIILAIAAMFAIAVYGQTEKKAYELGMKAIQQMESGNIKEAIELLEQSKKLDPGNITYPYEISYAHYLDKNYKAAIKVLKGLTKHEQVNGRIWQMLGNCYDMDGKPSKAIATYEKGLKLFPNSGLLYLERGNMEMQKEEYNNALGYYEKGIEVQPQFPSNYYWASKIYLSSTEEVWGMIYGELFMNLERNSSRTIEISKMLYDTYKSQIQFTSDTSFSVSFSQNILLNIGDVSDASNFKLPFGIGCYEPILMLSLLDEKSIDINSLHRVRSNFLDYYFKNDYHKEYPNILFDFQKTIEENGHLEAYNHWLLMKGDEDAFIKWHDSNTEKWDAFVAWFTDNPIEVTNEKKFHSTQY